VAIAEKRQVQIVGLGHVLGEEVIDLFNGDVGPFLGIDALADTGNRALKPALIRLVYPDGLVIDNNLLAFALGG